MNKISMNKKISALLIIFFFSSKLVLAQVEDDQIDFGTPGEKKVEVDESCNLSSDQELLKLLNFPLKKFDPNPQGDSEIGSAEMSPQDVKQNTIRFYNEQLSEVNMVKLKIETFVSLGGDTLSSLINRSSKISLKHPEKCEFFSLYGDQIIGSYEMAFERILKLYASAVNKKNNIAQEFVRTQLTPSKMSVDDAIKALYDDYGYQQNVIESLLPEDVRVLFFGENQLLNIADVAESKLLAFSLLGGEIFGNSNEELFVFAPESKKGLLGSNETIIFTSTGKLYEVPLLNIPLALNVMRSLGFNAKIIILNHIYIDEKSYCKVGEAGMWYHFNGDQKQMGCDFLSNAVKSIREKTLEKSEGYELFKESIDRVTSFVNKKL
ncbi:MAG: hypothetical protein CMM91_07965 [Rickettsiales bacterium]|nr:hypothetical protein [Rickettsiales bacterium]|tara:strand:+ start:59 stop:1195 length:1137 start_codon:yes stop_codon:yes gene_type:complete